MPTEEDAARDLSPDYLYSGAESLLVGLGAASRRRPVGAHLPERQVAAKDGKTCRAEGFGESHEKSRLAVGSGTMGENERTAGLGIGKMQKPADWDLARSIDEVPERHLDPLTPAADFSL